MLSRCSTASCSAVFFAWATPEAAATPAATTASAVELEAVSGVAAAVSATAAVPSGAGAAAAAAAAAVGSAATAAVGAAAAAVEEGAAEEEVPATEEEEEGGAGLASRIALSFMVAVSATPWERGGGLRDTGRVFPPPAAAGVGGSVSVVGEGPAAGRGVAYFAALPLAAVLIVTVSVIPCNGRGGGAGGDVGVFLGSSVGRANDELWEGCGTE